MNLHEFYKDFGTESKCRLHYKSMREKLGVECKKCGNTRQYWLKAKWQWQCSNCKFRTTLRSGTAMHAAKLPFQKWYLCMAIMIATKKGISAKEMQRQLGHKRYRTIWTLMQKIRFAMGNHEIDEFSEMFAGRYDSDFQTKKERLKPLRKVYRNKVHVHYAHMRVLRNDYTNVPTHISGMYQLNDRIYLSGSPVGKEHLKHCYSTRMKVDIRSEIKESSKKWINRIRSNFENNLIGTHHCVSLVYLSNYLLEFSYRLNRRHCIENRFDVLVDTIARRSLWYV